MHPAHLPQQNDDAVEDVEALSDVLEQSEGYDFHQHFNGKEEREECVTVFKDFRQETRLCRIDTR